MQVGQSWTTFHRNTAKRICPVSDQRGTGLLKENSEVLLLVLEYPGFNCIRTQFQESRISFFLPTSWLYSLTGAFGMAVLIVIFALKQAKHIGTKNFHAIEKEMPALIRSLGLPDGPSCDFGNTS
jgi:hypothetical protein